MNEFTEIQARWFMLQASPPRILPVTAKDVRRLLLTYLTNACPHNETPH